MIGLPMIRKISVDALVDQIPKSIGKRTGSEDPDTSESLRFPTASNLPKPGKDIMEARKKKKNTYGKNPILGKR